MSSANRGRPVRNGSDGNLVQYSKQKRPHQKTPKQFSAKSRSKSNVSFKNFQKLHKVSSHEVLSKSLLDPMKKSRSSDSLQHHKVPSGLSMTALMRTASHPVVSENSNAGSKNRPRKRLGSHSVLVLHDSEDNESITDEEVDTFSDEDKEESESDINDNLSPKQGINQNSINEVDDLLEETISRTDSNKNIQRQLSYKPPSRLRNRVDDDDDRISGKDPSGRTQYYVTGGQEDYIGLADIQPSSITNGLKRHGSQFPPDKGQVGHEKITCENGPEEHYNGNENESQRNFNNRLENGTRADEDRILPIDDNRNKILVEHSNYGQESVEVANEQYVPDMILSQSTGMERRFDQLSRQSSMAWVNQGENQVEQMKTREQGSNNFNYINQDLAASLTDENISQTNERASDSARHDFSTSISSLTSHLQKAVPKAPQQKSGINFENIPTQYSSKELAPTEKNSLSGLTDFSNFLQTSEVGGDSRTQQKLWLQRENSIQDLSSQNSNHDSVFLASNVEARREFERISREYTNVRRFSNPLADSLHRVALQQNIEIKKHKKAASNEASGGLLVLDRGRNKGGKDVIPCGDKLEMQRQLTKIWNNSTAQFNRIDNPLAESPSDILSSHTSTLRNPRTVRATSSHQRGLHSLHPTTRAVNRRMEHVINQQHI